MKNKIDELLEATRNIEGGIVAKAKRQMDINNFVMYYMQTRMRFWGDFVDVYNGAAS